MQHSLTQIGDSLVFVIPEEIRQRWSVRPETPLEVTADGDTLILKPLRDAGHEASVDAAMLDADRDYGKTFRRLAE